MKDNGGSAFPQMAAMDQNGSWIAANKHCPEASGMSLRDYFAAATLPMFANESLLVAADESFPNDPTRVAIAKYVFAVADSMLAEREK